MISDHPKDKWAKSIGRNRLVTQGESSAQIPTDLGDEQLLWLLSTKLLDSLIGQGKVREKRSVV